MALIKCPECGNEISDKCTQCVHCGYPLLHNNSLCSVVINETGNNRLETIKYVRVVTGLNLKPAMELVDSTPSILLKDISIKKAEQIKQELNKLGNSVFIKTKEECDFIRSNNNKNIVSCPRCGSTAVTTGQKGYSLLTGFIGSNKTVNRCGKCGWSWEPRK